MTPRKLSHYEIREELSRGGMGVVYRALDVKLEREVALKILLPDLVKNEFRKRRFIQEAKAAAALKHPNIAVIYEIDDAEDETFIAMELIEGWKLSDLLAKERLSISRATAMAVEILEGLSSAHEKGIVHRDLKPANLMVTEDGHIKVIDFGLAKLVERVPSVNDADSDAQTKVKGDTQEGQVLGTVAYMSPEQARGQTVDNRTDLFAFGIVFYEMLTGETPFHGSSAVETMSAIIHQPAPPVSRSVKGPLAEALSRIVERCLEKDPEDRHQTAKDLLSEVRRVKRDSESGARVADVSAAPGGRRVLGWALLGIGAFAVLAYSLLRFANGPAPLPRFTHPIQVTLALGVEDYPSWSPDGQTLAYQSNQAGNWDIWLTQVGSGQHLNRTEDHEGDDYNPSWSPDGREIAFISNRDDWGAYVMSPLTGSPRRVAVLAERSPQWSSAGTQLAYVLPVAGEGAQAEVLSLASGESRRFPLPGSEISLWDLSWSPDGRFFVYLDGPGGAQNTQITQLWLVRVDGEAIPITNGKWNDQSPSWSKDGKYLYFVSNRGGAMDLWRQEMGDGVVMGEPEPLTVGVGMRTAFFAPDGTRLAYSRGHLVGSLWRVPIRDDSPATWGDAQQLTFDEAHVEFADVSPDGTRIVVSSDRAGNPDLWLMPAGGGELQQLTTDPTPDWFPRFSPDGSRIAFYAYRSGNRDLWVMPASGGQATQITQNPAQDYFPSWSPDGNSLAFVSVRDGNQDVYAIAIDGSGEKRLTDDPAPDFAPAISPDGAWIVFSRLGSEGWGVWRMPREGGEPLRLTPAGDNPIWSRDGRAVYFLDRNDVWIVPAGGGEVRKLTDFSGKRGSMALDCLATDGKYLYFTWVEDAGDIWVMDVVYE
jgi:Tol biopolymer transport system component/predicted Ser/Thr protein kinase